MHILLVVVYLTAEENNISSWNIKHKFFDIDDKYCKVSYGTEKLSLGLLYFLDTNK